jgi:hypothetical protein
MGLAATSLGRSEVAKDRLIFEVAAGLPKGNIFA